MKKIVILIFFFSLGFYAPILAAQDYLKDDFKRTAQEMKQVQRQIKQAEQEVKKDFEQTRRQKFRQESESFQIDGAQAGALQSIFVSMAFLMFLFLLLYIAYRFLKPISKNKKADLINNKDVLAQVGQWVFKESDFTAYLEKLKSVITPEVMELTSDNFRRSFIQDIFFTEIIFRIAIESKLGEDEQIKGLLLSYSNFLVAVDINSPEFTQSFIKYGKRCGDDNLPFINYYQDFLRVFLVIGAKFQLKSFEIYARYLFVNKLIANLLGSPDVLNNLQGAQLKINAMVKNYFSGFEVAADHPFVLIDKN